MILFAVLGACAYGIADFFGGVASRKAHVLRVVVISAPASLAIELILLPFLGAAWSWSAVVWGALSGIASAFAFSLLYRALALGPMSVLAPVTAVVSALLPVLVGVVVQGERLSLAAWVGVPIAVGAIVLSTVTRFDKASKVTGRAMVVACLAGAAIAAQLVALDSASPDSGIAPLITGRAVSSVVLLAAAGAMRGRLGTARPPLAMAAAAGCLDSLANLFFLLATRSGLLSISAIIVALYPAATVVLARVVLRERLGRVQWIGVGTSAAGVVLLAQA